MNTKPKIVGAVVLLLAVIFGPIIYLHSAHVGVHSASDLITAPSSHYQVIDLVTLPGYNWCEANGINDKGQILCTAGIRNGYDPWLGTTRAFLWENGRQRDLGMLKPYPISSGVAINSQGQILGITSLSASKSASTRIFLWQNGQMSDLDTLSLPGRDPHALSDQADIVGAAFPKVVTEAKTAFLWKAGKGRYLGLPFPSAANAVVHRQTTSPLIIVGDLKGNGFLWQNGKLSKLRMAGTWGTQLRAVNASGQSVGCVEYPTGHTHALLWQNGKTTDLGALGPKQDSLATAINDKGIVVGWSSTAPAEVMHAVLWNGKVIQDLNEAIITHPRIVLSSAEGINNHNQIICNGSPADESDAEQQHAYLLVPR